MADTPRRPLPGDPYGPWFNEDQRALLDRVAEWAAGEATSLILGMDQEEFVALNSADGVRLTLELSSAESYRGRLEKRPPNKRQNGH